MSGHVADWSSSEAVRQTNYPIKMPIKGDEEDRSSLIHDELWRARVPKPGIPAAAHVLAWGNTLGSLGAGGAGGEQVLAPTRRDGYRVLLVTQQLDTYLCGDIVAPAAMRRMNGPALGSIRSSVVRKD